MKQFLLNSAKNNEDVNVESSEYISLSTKQRALPSENLQGVINHYELYLKERNECKNFKLIFTLHPYMSNVLFNPFTEIVYNEGDIESGIIGTQSTPLYSGHMKYFTNRGGNNVTYKALTGGTVEEDVDDDGIDRRYQLLRDTEFSHPDMGNLTYHCGLDIFNNHYLRSDGLFRIKKGRELGGSTNNNEVFNTIKDYLVYSNGYIAKHENATPGTDETVGGMFDKLFEEINKALNIFQDLINKLFGKDKVTEESETHVTEVETGCTHLFNNENLKPITTAFSEGIKEDNGWIGFYNRGYLPEVNVSDKFTINKCLNNKGTCDFVDLYPDRTLFSFTPKINYGYSGREEYNWKWCLTYPCENVYQKGENEPFDFFDKDKGLKIIWNSKTSLLSANGVENGVMRDGRFVYFRTKARHNLESGSIVKISYDGGDFSLRILGVGDENMENKPYYFFVSYDDLSDEFGESSLMLNSKEVYYVPIPNNLYVAKINDGYPCKYYIRKFKKIKDLSSTLNKVAFSKTIFNDSVIQLIYNENVNIEGLKDNWGREISYLYLTLIKNNKGHEKYYLSGITNPYSVEYSHCFGKVTSGFNFECSDSELAKVNPKLDDDIKEYNIRTAYNLENFEMDNAQMTNFLDNMGISYAPSSVLEDNITEDDDVFYGDFVEFSPMSVIETTIENVYHRFNTAQRETKLDGTGKVPYNFKVFKYDELEFDDFDYDYENDSSLKIGVKAGDYAGFKVVINQNGFRGEEGEKRDADICDNIFPEGYFYQPHYGVKLKEYSSLVSFDFDIPIVQSAEGSIVSKRLWSFEFETPIPYALTNTDKIILYYKDGTYAEYYVNEGSRGNRVMFTDYFKTLEEINDGLATIFFKNPDIPDYAYYLNDGTGKYVWRELVKDTELGTESDIYNRTYANGAVYINSNINFYLRRQDPYGIYGLKYTPNNKNASKISNFIVGGLEIELPDINYKTEENYSTCEN